MIRYLELVFDLSKAAGINDMRPMRSAAMYHAAEKLIRSFFDENPLSQLGIVIMRDGVAQQLTELSSSPVRLFSIVFVSFRISSNYFILKTIYFCRKCILRS